MINDISEATIRLVHKAKKTAGAVMVTVEDARVVNASDNLADRPSRPCHSCGGTDYWLMNGGI